MQQVWFKCSFQPLLSEFTVAQGWGFSWRLASLWPPSREILERLSWRMSNRTRFCLNHCKHSVTLHCCSFLIRTICVLLTQALREKMPFWGRKMHKSRGAFQAKILFLWFFFLVSLTSLWNRMHEYCKSLGEFKLTWAYCMSKDINLFQRTYANVQRIPQCLVQICNWLMVYN